jgi:hypothetical protein
MRLRTIIVVFVLLACSDKNESNVTTLAKEKLIQNSSLYSGDSEEIMIHRDLDLDKLEPVDSAFYFTYLNEDLHFCGFRQKLSKVGGPDCEQFYFGEIQSKSDYRQILILQQYRLNVTIKSMFLLTFGEDMTLKSVLEVASLIDQAELAPEFRSIIYYDSITKFEITRNLVPEDIIEGRWLMCRDSLTKKFKFQRGEYTVTQFDSVRLCNWIAQD